jgi:hypothetical protein
MPVHKFRSLADAEQSLWYEPGDPSIWEAARVRWAIHRALGRRTPAAPRGVRRYRSIEDRQRDDPEQTGT